jgi:hypothetical protein
LNLGGFAALSAVREVQVPLLAFLLVSGCSAKARKAVMSRSVTAALGPTAMFPLRLRRPVAIFMCASELGLGIALVLTSGRVGSGMPANLVRAATALLFFTAMGALHELRTHRPDVGCGCFGDLSDTPVGLRTIGRSALLAGAALVSIGAPPLHMPSTPAAATWLIVVGSVEAVVIGALSPELGELLVRLGYSEPCEVRRIPVTKTLGSLHSSTAYRRYRRQLSGVTPRDIWREGCWRFLVYPTTISGREADIVFAVYLQAHRPPVRVVVLDPSTGEELSGRGTRPEPVAIPAPRFELLSAPVPADTGLPAVTFVQPSRSAPVHHAVHIGTAGKHAGFSRFIQPHTGTHQTRRRHSADL